MAKTLVEILGSRYVKDVEKVGQYKERLLEFSLLCDLYFSHVVNLGWLCDFWGA